MQTRSYKTDVKKLTITTQIKSYLFDAGNHCITYGLLEIFNFSKTGSRVDRLAIFFTSAKKHQIIKCRNNSWFPKIDKRDSFELYWLGRYKKIYPNQLRHFED